MLPNNLEDLTDHELQRLEKMLDIAKIQADIEMTRQSVNESRATVEQMKANTEKIAKEARFYPYITLISAMIGGLVVALITQLL
ncbi:hypothetical protein [Moraxella macacae]|nr:hypothetical protein [Moraxella macacae]